MATPWYRGICDTVLAKLQIWYRNYDKGEVFATRKYMDEHMREVDKVVKRAHKIAWTKPELEHLQRLLADNKEGVVFAEEVGNILKVWEKGLLLRGGQRVVELAFYPEHVKKMLDLVTQAKFAAQLNRVENRIEEARQGGKDLFEV